MGVGLLCSRCGRLIPATEIAWQTVGGQWVCAQCFYADMSKQAEKPADDE